MGEGEGDGGEKHKILGMGKVVVVVGVVGKGGRVRGEMERGKVLRERQTP